MDTVREPATAAATTDANRPTRATGPNYSSGMKSLRSCVVVEASCLCNCENGLREEQVTAVVAVHLIVVGHGVVVHFFGCGLVAGSSFSRNGGTNSSIS